MATTHPHPQIDAKVEGRDMEGGTYLPHLQENLLPEVPHPLLLPGVWGHLLLPLPLQREVLHPLPLLPLLL